MSEDHHFAARSNFIGLDEGTRAALRSPKSIIGREASGTLVAFNQKSRLGLPKGPILTAGRSS